MGKITKEIMFQLIIPIIISLVIMSLTIILVYHRNDTVSDEQNTPKIERNIESNEDTTPKITSEKKALEPVTEPVPMWVSLGEFKLSAYCGENYHHICNDGDATTTSTGTRPVANHTVAVDPKKIPYGSILRIGDTVYVAEDCGGSIKGNRIDIFFDSHSEAVNYGRRTVEAKVYYE